jgi:ankyrin repeat protein
VDNVGRTAVDWVCQKGSAETVKILRENGIDVSFSDSDGRTALHEAALHDSAVKAALLIDKTDLAK